MMEPIEHRPSRHLSFLSFLSFLVVATFAGVVALATMIATGGGRDRALERRWYGMLASGNPAILGTFRTENLIVDQTSSLGSAAAVTVTVNTTGSAGQEALFSTFAGSGTDGQNIWIGGGGQHATMLINATQGSSNASFGKFALDQLTTGSYNTALGHDTMPVCTTCIDNTATGQAALLSLTSGIENTAIGVQSLELVTNGSFNTAVGLNALQFCNGQNNTAIGLQAGESNATGSSNVFVGEDAGQFGLGSNSTIVGTQAGLNLTTGNNNTFVGAGAGSGITTGASNTIIGSAIGLASGTSNHIILADGDGNQRVDVGSTGIVNIPVAVNIAASTATRLLDINGNGNQINLQNSVNNSHLDIISNSGGTIWDIDPLPAVASDNQEIRVFRHTVTSGTRILELWGSSTAIMDLHPDAVSTARFGLNINLLSVANSALAILDSLTAQTHGYQGINVQGSGNTFNTTAAAISNWALYGDGSGVRSSGANKLITVGVGGESRDSQLAYGGYFVAGNSADGLAGYGVYSTAPGGSASYSGYFDAGNFQANGHHLSVGHTPTLSASCTSGTGSSIVGTDTDFKVITGSTSVACVITFQGTIAWPSAPICTVYPEGGAALPTCTIAAAAITCTTNIAATYNWHCGGVGTTTPDAPASPVAGN